MRKLSSFLFAVVLLSGCEVKPANSGPTKPSAKVSKQVSVAELGRETDHLVFFKYVGSDADFHYFTTAETHQFKVPRAEWNNPSPFSIDKRIQLFVTVKDGKLAVPDPAEMAALTEEERLQRPFKKKKN